MTKKNIRQEQGMITPMMLVILSVFMVFATSIMSWSFAERKNVVRKERETEALQIAEAGIDYYKWHLAHDEEDFKNGKDWCCNNDPSSTPDSCGGACGPYREAYKDYEGNEIGEFVLRITPPSVGSTIMQVESAGKTSADNTVSRTIVAKLGKRSLATYSFLSNSPIWIGEEESTSGPLHSNGGIRFDGSGDAEITSAVESYDGSSANHGFSGTKPGIWGSADPDVTKYWSFPEPNIDFDLFTVDMAKMKAQAQAGEKYLAPSNKNGYKIIFQSNGTYRLYIVDSTNPPVKYINDSGGRTQGYESPNKVTLLGTFNMPQNGIIFVEDNVWVEGSVNGRVTLAASRFSQNSDEYARITINDDLIYVARDGSNVLGLVAEGDVLVPRHAPEYLTIDAVMLSQKGHVYAREYVSSAVKQEIEVYGGIISDLFWTWSYVSGSHHVDGYNTTVTIYDNHLTYSPPPFFPTEENFEIISWSEK